MEVIITFVSLIIGVPLLVALFAGLRLEERKPDYGNRKAREPRRNRR